MKCVVGLGNPGRKYTCTRHNAGYMVLSELARRMRVKFVESGFSDVAEGVISDSDSNVQMLLVKPATYMNASGQAIAEALSRYRLTASDLLVIHDDLDLPFGKIRVRQNGSSGGHKGIASTISHLGTTEFMRLKIGIGRPLEGHDVIDHVLEPFSRDEVVRLSEVVGMAADAAVHVFIKGIEAAMAEYNGKEAIEESGGK